MGIRHNYRYEGNPVAAGSTPVFGLGGYPTVSIQVVGEISAGTYTPQVSNDGGQTWADIQVVSSGGTSGTTIDAAGAFRVDANGFQSLRLLPDSITGAHLIYMFASEEPFSRPGTGGGAASEVEVTASVLPTGAATAARQDTGNTALSAIQTAVQVMDDWDESDRAKVNVIAGQAGITAGAGAVAANTPRVTHASDDPAVTALQLIDNLVLAEDSVAASGDPGLAVFAVRRDSPSAGGADGDYVNLSTDSTGALRVTGGSGGASATDDSAFTAGSGSGTPMMGFATSDAVDSGDVGVVGMTQNRALFVNLRDSSGNELSAGAQYAEDSVHVSGDMGTVALAVQRNTPASGASDGDYATLNVNSSGRLYTASTLDAAVPAGTNLIGRVSASNETSTIYNGTTAITPKWAVISAASSGDNTVVAAVASNHIRVVALTLISSGSVSVRFESGAGGTALTGVMPLVASSGFTLPYNPVGWFETGINTLLNLELSAATGVYGFLTYIEVP